MFVINVFLLKPISLFIEATTIDVFVFYILAVSISTNTLECRVLLQKVPQTR